MFAVAGVLGSATASAASVTPVFISGNPSCDGGIKIDPVVSGTYGPVRIVVSGSSFSFYTVGDAVVSDVIVKGGPNANWYHYDPPVTSDTGLTAPLNPNSGKPYGLSHLCFSVDDKKFPDPSEHRQRPGAITRSVPGPPSPEVPVIRRLAPAVLAAALLTQVPGIASAAEPLQPDLGMARISDLKIATTASGQRQLRFSATIVNVGRGPFGLVADRASEASSFVVSQRVPQSDGSRVSVGVPASLVYGGDGHGHWHVRDLESYQLVRLDNGSKVGTSSKGGFCFFDTDAYRLTLPGAPQSSVYSPETCGHLDSLTVSMGLSVGWGDRYPWTLPDQYIDITGLANGQYRLIATADAQGLFVESNRANNSTWVDIAVTSRKSGTSVKILDYGPAA